jgi:DNA-binding transcriptional ArsR family regulator
MPVPEQDFIIAPAIQPVRVSLAPTQNAFHSLWLLTKADQISGLGDWVTHTLEALTPQERKRHNLVMIGFSYAVTPRKSWSSFPVYVDHLASLSPIALRDKLLDTYARFLPLEGDACQEMADDPLPLDKEAILESVDAYLDFLQARFPPNCIDTELESNAYTYLLDPPAMQQLIVSHLRFMWHNYLALEWQRVEPMLEDAVAAFQQIDLSQMSRLEAGELITGQKLEEKWWQKKLQQAEQVVFVPSAHVGPYLGKFKTGNTFGVVFGARLPQGVRFHAPDLSRAEILVRLSALADETRLRILKLVSEEGELSSQEIMGRLDLSQSAASRHLKQLSAASYLWERRCQGAKCYSLNPERIEDTLEAISAFLLKKSKNGGLTFKH